MTEAFKQVAPNLLHWQHDISEVLLQYPCGLPDAIYREVEMGRQLAQECWPTLSHLGGSSTEPL